MEDRIAKRDKQRLQLGREELVERIARALPMDGVLEVAPGFRISRASVPTESTHTVYHPAVCFIAQGSKFAHLGNKIYRYDPENYMIYTVDLPLVFRVDEATHAKPYLGLRLDLDPVLITSVIDDSDLRITKRNASAKAVDVNPMDIDLFDTVVRLVRLIDAPLERKALLPLVVREIVFRLLAGGQGPRLAHLLTTGETQRISKAICYLREHFDEPIKIENIARDVGMGISAFHEHFKSVTAMSPLQYQKQIRLQEARRLMIAEDLDAASAGFRVGYEDPSYFSRDYKKQFGAPPQRDIARLRENLEK